MEVPPPRSSSCIGGEVLHLLVDSTGLKLCGAGEWLVEKHGTKTRRSWRKLHIGMDAGSGEIVAATLTTNDVDDASKSVRCLISWKRRWPRLLATVPMTRIASTAS
jgi:hypothetical protein